MTQTASTAVPPSRTALERVAGHGSPNQGSPPPQRVTNRSTSIAATAIIALRGRPASASARSIQRLYWDAVDLPGGKEPQQRGAGGGEEHVFSAVRAASCQTQQRGQAGPPQKTPPREPLDPPGPTRKSPPAANTAATRMAAATAQPATALRHYDPGPGTATEGDLRVALGTARGACPRG